jgi:hypothetical protein
MGMVEGLTSTAYVRVATVAVALAYMAGILVWAGQALVVGL